MKDICKNYGDFRASDHVSFGIEKGKLVALLGPSGSGKTTLLRMIAGLETPNSGDIYIDGQRVNDVPAAKRGIGFVFQNYALFRYMTVYDNVAFGLELMKMPKKENKKTRHGAFGADRTFRNGETVSEPAFRWTETACGFCPGACTESAGITFG